MMLLILYIYGALLLQTTANTITQFIKPLEKQSSELAEPEYQHFININVDYNQTAQINDFKQYINMPHIGEHHRLHFTFNNVPTYKDNNVLNGFFNKICWSPVSGVDLDNLGYIFNAENHEITVTVDIISLSKYVEGFFVYISLEELSYFGILPWSIVSMVKFLIFSIGSILSLILLLGLYIRKKYYTGIKREKLE